MSSVAKELGELALNCGIIDSGIFPGFKQLKSCAPTPAVAPLTLANGPTDISAEQGKVGNVCIAKVVSPFISM